MLGPTFNTRQKACTVNFTSTSNTSNSGISGLDFIFIVADDATSVVHPTSGDVLDWDEVVNGTLKVGSPALTVDIVPDGKGEVEANSVPLTGDPNVTYWTWDQVVNLDAIESTVGWEFDSWTGTDNDSSTASSNSRIMPAYDLSLVVNYTEISLPISVTMDQA